jgi:hypothetical protein
MNIEKVRDIAAEKFRTFPDRIRNSPFTAAANPSLIDSSEFSDSMTAHRLEAIIDTCHFLLGDSFNIHSCGTSFEDAKNDETE